MKRFFNPVTLFGLFFLVLGLLVFFTFDPKEYDRTATGTIVEMEQYQDPGDDEVNVRVYVDYVAEGTRYQHVEYNSYNFTMDIGDEVKLYYKSSDPSQIAAPGKDIMPFVSLGAAILGAVVFLGGITGKIKLRG